MKKLTLFIMGLCVFILGMFVVLIAIHVVGNWTCYSTGGRVSLFGSGCANYCSEIPSDQQVCTDAIETSCDCGVGECWTGEKCTLTNIDNRGGTDYWFDYWFKAGFLYDLKHFFLGPS